jgi:hypothetical protein
LNLCPFTPWVWGSAPDDWIEPAQLPALPGQPLAATSRAISSLSHSATICVTAHRT